MRTHIDDWLVAVHGDEIIGCVSLVFFNSQFCEIRSLAVHPNYRNNGLGSELIKAVLDLANRRKVQRVLTLTRSVGLFESLGFRHVQVANFPAKVWQDCDPCPFRHCCDEIALVFFLDDSQGTINER